MIDRRFIDAGIFSEGTYNDISRAEGICSTQYIVGSNPTESYATANSIARYSNGRWKYIVPKENAMVYDIIRQKFKRYISKNSNNKPCWLDVEIPIINYCIPIRIFDTENPIFPDKPNDYVAIQIKDQTRYVLSVFDNNQENKLSPTPVFPQLYYIDFESTKAYMHVNGTRNDDGIIEEVPLIPFTLFAPFQSGLYHKILLYKSENEGFAQIYPKKETKTYIHVITPEDIANKYLELPDFIETRILQMLYVLYKDWLNLLVQHSKSVETNYIGTAKHSMEKYHYLILS